MLFPFEKGVLLHISIENVSYLLNKSCIERNVSSLLCLHKHMQRTGLQDHLSLGNILFLALLEAGNIFKAYHVFNRLSHPDERSWNYIITAFVNYGELSYAFELYDRLVRDGQVQPSEHTIVSLLKACKKLKNLEKGIQIHEKVTQFGFLEKNVFIASTLVGMYSKCGLLTKARHLVEQLPARNVVLLTEIMSGYLEHGRGEEALSCYEHMQSEGILPDAAALVCALKACGNIGASEKGKEVHNQIESQEFLKGNVFVANTLVDMYSKCGLLDKARQVFDKLPVKNVVSWNALISGYADHGDTAEALEYFEQMQSDDVKPDAVTISYILKSCGNLKDIYKGGEVHAEVERRGLFEVDPFVCHSLIHMYAMCGFLDLAEEVFYNLHVVNVVSFNTLIAGYVEQGSFEKALIYLDNMQLRGICPTSVTFVSCLKACCCIGAIDKGTEIHAEIERNVSIHDRSLVLRNTLIDMYAKCGFFDMAQDVFDKLQKPDVVSWSILTMGYAEHGCEEGVFDCLQNMQLQGILPTAVTFVCILKACSDLAAMDMGIKLHVEIERQGLLQKDLGIGTALVGMYAKCGLLTQAQGLFDTLSSRDIDIWNTLLSGYVEHGHGAKALNCFELLQLDGLPLNCVTYVWSLKACSIIGDIVKAEDICREIEVNDFLGNDPSIGTAMVDLYAKHGLLTKAQEVFDKLHIRDVVSWTALIAGYADHECGEDALKCYEQMQREGISPNAVTFISCIKACANLGAVNKISEIHAEIKRVGLIQRDLLVGNALVDIYARCGLPKKAHQVFDDLPMHNIVSFTSLMAGYAHVGEAESVFHVFSRMLEECGKPDAVAFVVVLNACSQRGMFDESQTYLEAMSKDYGIFPTNEHYNCLVDILGRIGELDKAISMFKETPSHPDLVACNTILSSCRSSGNAAFANEFYSNMLSTLIGEKIDRPMLDLS